MILQRKELSINDCSLYKSTNKCVLQEELANIRLRHQQELLNPGEMRVKVCKHHNVHSKCKGRCMNS